MSSSLEIKIYIITKITSFKILEIEYGTKMMKSHGLFNTRSLELIETK